MKDHHQTVSLSFTVNNSFNSILQNYLHEMCEIILSSQHLNFSSFRPFATLFWVSPAWWKDFLKTFKGSLLIYIQVVVFFIMWLDLSVSVVYGAYRASSFSNFFPAYPNIDKSVVENQEVLHGILYELWQYLQYVSTTLKHKNFSKFCILKHMLFSV